MNELYSHECPACSGKHPRNEAEIGINFSSEVLSQALRAIYDGMNVEDEIQRDAFEEMLRIFNEAAVEGVLESKKTPPRMETFLEQLKYNNEVFSAFKVHRMQNDMAARLIDENGQLKPFEKWKRDVEDIADHYCNRWLQTEYDTAVLRAHQATDWLQFEAEKDVYPNLRWMPTTSPNPDEYHKQYWRAKLTLPINHPFWKSHRPGDRWNCKCWLMQTDEPATTEAVADFKPVSSQPGLDNNPAQDGKLFSDSHPYYTNAYPGAKKAAEKIVNDINNPKALRKRLEKWYKKNLPTVKVGKMEMKRFEVATPEEQVRTVINRNFYEETASKHKDSPEYSERLELAKQAHLIFPKSKYVRDEEPRDHPEVITFKVYEYETGHGVIEFKCKVNNDGYFLHYMRLIKE